VDGTTGATISGAYPTIFFGETDTTDLNTRLRTSGGSLNISTVNDSYTGGLNRFNIDHSTGDISFYENTGTTPKFFWDASAESLGIGTSSPAYELHTYGNVGISDDDDSSSYRFIVDDDGTDARFRIRREKANGASSASNDLTIVGGNVGIGTTSPGFPLDVQSTGVGSLIAARIYRSDGSQALLRIGNSTSGSASSAPAFGSDANDAVVYTNNAEAMRITSDGALLVGKSTADSGATAGIETNDNGRLNATRNGSIAGVFNRLTSDGDIVQFRKDGATVGSIGNVGANVYIASQGAAKYVLYNSAFAAADDNSRDLGLSSQRFKDLYLSGGLRGDTTFKNNAGTTEYARFDSIGNLLVGKTSSSLTTSGVEFSPLGKILATRSSAQAANFSRTTTAGAVVGFFSGATEVGTVSVTGSSTSYNTSSDYRLKEDTQPMVGASDRVLSLKPVNFAWKTDGSRTDGFIAHEAQAVVPEAVTGEKDAVDADGNPEYQGIDQSKLVPLLTAALQEALQKIETLEARVAALEA
jgi:hypothetical protein